MRIWAWGATCPTTNLCSLQARDLPPICISNQEMTIFLSIKMQQRTTSVSPFTPMLICFRYPKTRGAHIIGKKRVMQVLPNCTRARSEEHTSELQSRENLVCRLLLEKKK